MAMEGTRQRPDNGSMPKGISGGRLCTRLKRRCVLCGSPAYATFVLRLSAGGAYGPLGHTAQVQIEGVRQAAAEEKMRVLEKKREKQTDGGVPVKASGKGRWFLKYQAEKKGAWESYVEELERKLEDQRSWRHTISSSDVFVSMTHL
jgi:hypothetical protein